jgi:hypothetical protein
MTRRFDFSLGNRALAVVTALAVIALAGSNPLFAANTVSPPGF